MDATKRLKIGIAGSGLGGLAAACRLAQDGHQVHVFERAGALSTASGAIYVQSNAVRCIHRWGLAKPFEAVTTQMMYLQTRNGHTNEIMAKQALSQFSDVPAWATDRQALQDTFWDQAREFGATMSFGNPVTDVRETTEEAIVTCKDGQVHHFDLFIAADGISSRLRAKILPQYDAARLAPIPAPSTHYATYIPGDVLSSNNLTRSLVSDEDSRDGLMFAGNGGYVVAKYNHARHLMNVFFSIQHPAGSEEDKNPRLFDETGDPEAVRKFFDSFHPVVQKLAAMMKTCSRWRLARLEPLDTWLSPGRRLLLLGDSAHAMLPNVAQGFSSIVEDVDCLSLMLENATSAQKAAELWQNARMSRVQKLQEISLFNYGCYNRGIAPESTLTEAERNLPSEKLDGDAPFNSPPFTKWMLDYDTAQEARKFLAEHKSSTK